MRTLRLVAALTGLAALAAGAAAGSSRSWSYDASFLVDVHGGQSPGLELGLDFADRAPPGRVTLYVPKGFDIYPQRPTAYPIGVAEIEAGNSTYGSVSDASFLGQLSATTTDSPLAAAASACFSGDDIALWKLSLTLLGQPVDAPVAIGSIQVGDPPDTSVRIDFCPPLVPGPDPSTAPVLPMQSLGFWFSFIPAPSRAGSYTWHAVVTPVAPDGRTLLPSQAYELRSTYAVPHTLTLVGQRTKPGLAQLSGSLTAAGRPQAHRSVFVTRLTRKVVRGRVVYLDAPVGERVTDARGRYSLRVQLKATAGFVATTEAAYGACRAPVYAPGGCVSETMPGTASQAITLTVSAPRR